jgi:hypothetical protein
MARASSKLVPAVTTPGKAGKETVKIAVGVLMDKTDIVPDASYLSF